MSKTKQKNNLTEINFSLDKIKINFKSDNIFINIFFIAALVLMLYLVNDPIISFSILVSSITGLLFGIGYVIKSIKS
ncbi:MAG: hypothetical protein RSF67_05090 [Clostridia bacterium]